MRSPNKPRNVRRRSYVDDHDNDEDNVDDDDDDDYDYFGDLHSKKRKRKTELPASSPASKSSAGGRMTRNAHMDWTEGETFILLDAWGDQVLKKWRKRFSFEEWQEVAEKVSQESKIKRTGTQCRYRLDTLKKLYKKEKMELNDDGNSGCKWIFFDKMEVLVSSLPRRLDSGENVIINTKACLNQSDEMDDSPAHSEDNLEGRFRDSPASLNIVADSDKKISQKFKKVENDVRRQMVGLETLRMELIRDLEIQRREIQERALAEIAKIRHDDDHDDDDSDGDGDGDDKISG